MMDAWNRILERTTALVTDMIQREEQLQHVKKEVRMDKKPGQWLLSISD